MMATSKSLRKFKTGAMVRSKVLPGNIYVLDSQGLFHCGHDAITDIGIASLLNDHPEVYEVISEGADLPVDEPQGLGAVVDVQYDDSIEIRWVRIHTQSGAAWRAEEGGLSSWSGISDGKITVRHEGWNEQ